LIKVSVIVPNYNHFAYLSRRIYSIFNQTYQNFEIIILDDNSSDGSRDILSKYESHPKVAGVILNNENSGNTFSQWKKGIELAKGELIWIAESDDYCELDFLEKMVKPFLVDAEISLVFCQSQKVNSNSEVTGNWIEETQHFKNNIFTHDFCINGNKFIEKYLIFQNVIPNASAVLFKREIAIERDLPDTSADLIYSGDWVFYLQMIINKKIFFKNESLNYFRYHENSVIASVICGYYYGNKLIHKRFYREYYYCTSIFLVKFPLFRKLDKKNRQRLVSAYVFFLFSCLLKVGFLRYFELFSYLYLKDTAYRNLKNIF